ncbi:MAG: 1,4-alpha-glucan branching protein GlgB [Burkholderiales bacterium]
MSTRSQPKAPAYAPAPAAPVVGELDAWLIGEGNHQRLYEVLGAHPVCVTGVDGVNFALWAPNAGGVAVVGDFNDWDATRHPLKQVHGRGVWEGFVAGAAAGAHYKYAITTPAGGAPVLKADPFARRAELRPATASIVAPALAARSARRAAAGSAAPVSIYEVHAGSWRRGAGGAFLSWPELAETLLAHVKALGFTHIELLPVTEHPFDGSWGYQPTALFAPTARHGTPEQFADFVARFQDAGVGVILDWVPGHFPADDYALAQFDGTHLYEHADPRQGVHRDWKTLIYNYGRVEVRNFLIASALYWLETFGIDGLRVDAVASMLYLDYSRPDGEWVPNQFGGRENLEAVSFLRELNSIITARVPGAVICAEESTAWPGVTRAAGAGGLGFDYKWNMGWMHDTLDYMRRDPVHRPHHHERLTFGLLYAFDEHFILPLSHDEVVHGKGSLLGKMPGDRWQRFANLRAYYALMWAQPGKKLLFMGGEFGQAGEWNHDTELDWSALSDAQHAGVMRLIGDLNTCYRRESALCEDSGPAAFEWIDHRDREQSVISFLRVKPGAREVVVVCNFTPVPRHGYRVGVPHPGTYRELLNTDSALYGGSDLGNGGQVIAGTAPAHDRPASLMLTLPPLAVLYLAREET